MEVICNFRIDLSDSIIRRWFINGEAVPVAKIANMLEYPSKDSLHHAIKKYGIQLIMLKGLDVCKKNRGQGLKLKIDSVTD